MATTFSQSESVSRCRNVLESKLKALYGLAKLADEEVTIHNANIEGTYNDLRNQLSTHRSVERRQEAEAEDMTTSALRKRQLTNLVDKLTALKLQLRFQEEEIEKDIGLKSTIRQKRAAFQIRLARMDERHNVERNELMMAQNRMQSTVNHIREIELHSVKDPQMVRRKKKENEILSQQSKMQQQKEFEFLREMQIIKIKHLNQINEMEINFTDDTESLTGANRQEEFELIAKQTLAEQLAFDELEKQRRQMEVTHQVERQRGARTQTLRNLKKQEKAMLKATRSAVRAREQQILMDNPVIQGDMTMAEGRGTSETDDASSHTGSRNDASEDNTSQGATSDAEDADRDHRDLSDTKDGRDADTDNELGNEIRLHSETKLNSEKNKNVGGHEHDTEEEKVLSSMMAIGKPMFTFLTMKSYVVDVVASELGRDRIRNLGHHHRKLLGDIRALHRNLIVQKQREQRRKTSEVRKEQEEEIEAIKIEQAQSMNELMGESSIHNKAFAHITPATQKQSDDVRKDSDNSQRLLGMMLPAHVMEEIEAGRTPEPKSYDRVTLFFTDLVGFKDLVSKVSPISILHFLNRVYSCFDEIIARHEDLYKVESIADTYMIAAGLDDKLSEDGFQAATMSAAKCVAELTAAFAEMDLAEFGIEEGRLQFRAGIHSGPILAGIVGTKMGRYCLFGDTVNTSSRMCTTSLGSRIQVSEDTARVLRKNPAFCVEERGEVEVKGKGAMLTSWLSMA
ncbi:hypothetical protein HK101_005757 [Irineochytrium annulatum]|nr:hypothetical protein HK101_005757 [Irineochytrium annulatum]